MAVWTAITVYAIFSLLSGPAGLSAYRQLEAERELQWDNLRNLGALNTELENTKKDLLYDQDAITVYARQLGYGRPGEQFIRIVGLGGTQNPYSVPGQVYFAGTPDVISDKTIKIAALFAGLAAFVLFLVFDLLQTK